MKHVLIPTKLDAIAQEILSAKGFAVLQDADTALAELVKAHPETEALIVRSEEVTAAVIDALPNLKVVIRAGAGYDTIDTKHARRRRVDVMNTPGANANGVAEEVFALALACYRHVVPGDVTTRAGKWEKKKYMGRELHRKTLGIVGLGNIGQLVAKRSAGFEMRLLGYDPVISAAKAEDLGVKLVDLPTLFAEADIVSLHVPETDETRGMVNRDLLGRMKKGAMLVNCARSGIINEADLRALKAEKGLLFCNDVYEADAAGPKSVADIADVMLPHLGANTREANSTAARRAAEQLVAYAEKGVTTYVVNKGVPDGLDEAFQELAYHVAAVARQYLCGRAVHQIKCSFYGNLGPYAKWFLAPICAALSPEFDPLQDPEEAQMYLAERGIALEIRGTDESKHYGNSMTIDLSDGDSAVGRVSVRGTITEGNIMISRINDFDRLYFMPKGHALLVQYTDRPGVLARITSACADADLNIEDIRAPRDSVYAKALAVLKTNAAVPAAVVERIRTEIQPDVAIAISIP
ncbi:MAG: ACT domain-containing protein [Lentisphaerae bacterium]|nr:ACT domain-containing protein [Lentisphaerota bacterium]